MIEKTLGYCRTVHHVENLRTLYLANADDLVVHENADTLNNQLFIIWFCKVNKQLLIMQIIVILYSIAH